MRKLFVFLSSFLTLLLSGALLSSMTAQAAYVRGVDTTNTTHRASMEYLMGSEVGELRRSHITEVNVNGWVWLDAATDLNSLLTSATTPTGINIAQNSSGTGLSDTYYRYSRIGSNPNLSVNRDPANTIGTVQINQGVAGTPIDWSSGSKLPAGGGQLIKVAIFDNAGTIVPNARFRVQMLGKDESDNRFKVFGNGTGQFSPLSGQASFTFYDCDPSASSTCVPLPAENTAGGINPTHNRTTPGAGESFAQTNESGYSYIWATMAGVAASNLFSFQVRVSDAPAEVTTFPGDLDYSSVFPSYITSGVGYAPTSAFPNPVVQTVPWAPTLAGKKYTSQSFFRTTTSCLWGSNLLDPSSLTSVISPSTKVAGTGNSTLTVGLKSRCGTNLSGQKVTIQNPDGTTTTLTTNSSGVATMPIVDDGTEKLETYKTFLGLTATGSPALSPTMEFTEPPVPNASNSTIEINRTSNTADGSSTATVTVKVEDQFGNPIPAGTPICLEKSSGLGTLGAGPWTTNANGQVTTTITSPTVVGSATIKAWIGTCDSKGDEIGPVNIDFTPGAADPGPSTIEINKNTNTADGTSSATVTVKIVDQFGNPVRPGTEVCLEKTSGLGTLGVGPWETDANGNVTTTITSPTVVGDATIKAWIGPCGEKGGEVGSVDIEFTPGESDADNSTIEINKSSNPADGTSPATVTVKIVDEFGNPVSAGTQVCLAKSAGSGTLGTGPWATDANGNVTTTITSPTTSGSATITAWVGPCDDKGPAVGSVDIDFLPGAPDAGESTVTIDKTTNPADGSSSATVTVNLVDAFGNPIPAGTAVCIIKTAGTGTLGNGPWTTDANGRVTTTIASPEEIGNATITAYVGSCDDSGKQEIGPVNIEFTPRPPSKEESTIEADRTEAPADGETQTKISLRILDSEGNPVPAGTVICLALSDGTGTLGEGPWATDAEGNVETTLLAPDAEGFGEVTAFAGDCEDQGEPLGSVTVQFTPTDEQLAETGAGSEYSQMLLFGGFAIALGITFITGAAFSRRRRRVS